MGRRWRPSFLIWRRSDGVWRRKRMRKEEEKWAVAGWDESDEE